MYLNNTGCLKKHESNLKLNLTVNKVIFKLKFSNFPKSQLFSFAITQEVTKHNQSYNYIMVVEVVELKT